MAYPEARKKTSNHCWFGAFSQDFVCYRQIYPGEGFFSMAKKLYVGNLSYNTTEDGLRNLFSGFGTVASVKIIFDRESGNSKGFGFVEMNSDEEASAAIAGTNGKEIDGRQLRVNEAMDKPRRSGCNW
jgi:RNA recognition motif-containing protein